MTCVNVSDGVCLVAVSKTRSVAEIEAVYDQGIHHFGENYLQEAIPKIQTLKTKHAEIIRHYIGKIQSKKIKEIATYFDLVHSLDSLEHAKKLNQACQDLNKVMPVFVQVNLDAEPQKGGVLQADLEDFLKALQAFPNLAVLGLMLIPKPGDESVTLAKFQALKQISDDLGSLTAGKLSMGMSADYELAIQAGSTHVRIGTALFGSRK